MGFYEMLPDGVDGDLRVDVAVDLGGVHVGNMLEVGWESVVLADQGVEDISEVDVGVFITSIHTAMLVVEFNGTSNGLGQGESRGLGYNVAKLIPFFLSNVFSYQGVLGFDFWEFCHCNYNTKL